jgi:hypothetical protein
VELEVSESDAGKFLEEFSVSDRAELVILIHADDVLFALFVVVDGGVRVMDETAPEEVPLEARNRLVSPDERVHLRVEHQVVVAVYREG